MRKLSSDDLMNWWLEKYHDTSVKKVLEDHPEWDVNSKEWNSATFYKAYQVTQEQHDEWYEWAIDTISKHYKWSKKRTRQEFAFTYLNVAPMIKQP